VRHAFTLVELLVTIAMLAVIMGVVVPMGAKMLSRFEKRLARIERDQNLSHTRAEAFLKARDTNLTLDKHRYHIDARGVVIKHASTPDGRERK